MRYVIELGCIIDRAEKAGQIIEKRIVPAADIGFDRVSAGRSQAEAVIGVDHGGEIATGEIDKANVRPIACIDGDAHLRRPQYARIVVLDPLQIGQQAIQARLLAGRPDQSAIGRDADPIQHVRVENTGPRYGGKGQGDHNLLAAGRLGARETENVVKVGCANVDIGKDRIDGVRIVVVCHDSVLAKFLTVKPAEIHVSRIRKVAGQLVSTFVTAEHLRNHCRRHRPVTRSSPADCTR